ncbi:hypothetical protein [Roseateles terrae]|uniref:Uncharacterized protein n=1 Tax=Roseateles terrae TaxID=431060 RepID=A0ABR6GRL0_9BURK|nr:hypothetical protein [Roseateles terrae]MBB3194337.1 hypothetical protein [Roseateles terrae]OWQ88173.1 hypothetical protein CDN98_08570 [Roseateles terrae]
MQVHSVPLHLLPESAHGAYGWVPDLGLTVSGPAAMDDLWQLETLMTQQGMKLQATRMVYDRSYALDRLACAYARGDETLRELAQQIFDSFQRRGEWIGLSH